MPDATILVIEDETAQRNALCAFLKKKQYHFIDAGDQHSALHHFETETIDLVLSDMRLPDGSGEEILEKVKTIRPDIPFILMTAYGNTQQAVAAMKKGAADYITKPLDLSELDLIIRRELERSTLVSENRILRTSSKTMAAHPDLSRRMWRCRKFSIQLYARLRRKPPF